MKKLLVQNFIEQHPNDWEKMLSEKPYCITVSRDAFNGKNLVMLKYSQIDSDFNNELVRECRGIIFDEDTWEPVSVPFFKFGNVGESYCPKIDWATAHIGQKIDGSLCKIANINGNLLISTNGTILADKAPVAEQIGCKYKSFGDIAREILFNKSIEPCLFEEGFTYMFELVSPWTRVVIPHKSNNMYFLGRRNNKTFQETYFTDDPIFSKLFDIPAIYPLKSIDECIAATKAMPWDEEGYVVCDSKFNRVKVKSPSYVAAHNLKGNGVMSYARALELVRANEIDEICTYFEEFRPALEECKARFWDRIAKIQEAWEEYLKVDASLPTRKDKALWITSHFPIPGIAFGLLDKKITSVKSFFMDVPIEKLAKMLGYKDA